MTREELLGLVNKELGSIKLTLNERAINEELDDSLGDFGDDAGANARLVTRIANRLKRMDGSVHSAVSREVEEYKKNYKPKNSPKSGDDKDKGEDDDKDVPKWALEMRDELEALKEARRAERAEREKKDLLDSVKKGLEDKFKKAGNEANPFFVKTALAKLKVPEKDADVKTLTDEVERLYNADVKEAGLPIDTPRAGGKGGGGKEKIDEHEFDDIAKIVGRNRPQAES